MEFEDCFSLEMIARAINQVITEQGGKLQIKPEQLEKESEKGKSIVRTLKKILYENNLELYKPALAEKIAYLLNNIEISRMMGKEARMFIENNFSINKVVDSIETLYTEIVDNYPLY